MTGSRAGHLDARTTSAGRPAPVGSRGGLAGVPLGRIAGIPIALHYSWLIIATLITLSLEAHFAATNPGWSGGLLWTSAVTTAVLFFATLVAHELSHALMATTLGLPVRSITLFALGGVAEIEKEPDSARSEFLVAVAGPVTSLVIGFGCMAAARAMGWSLTGGAPGPLSAILGWLGSINVMLAIFNLLPGYPLDGGRLLRAILWWTTGNGERAVQTAARVGQALAGGLVALGLVQFFATGQIGGLWLVLIGWFLLDAARARIRALRVSGQLAGLTVGDIMDQDVDVVEPDADLQSLAEFIWRTGRRCLMVVDDERLLGMITPHQVRDVDRRAWIGTDAAAAMLPFARLRTVGPETPVADALAVMSRDDINQLPVIAGDRLLGVVTRTHVLALLQTRTALTG